MKMKNTLLKMIRYSCLLFVIVFGLMAIIGTNGGDGGGGEETPTPTTVTGTLTLPSQADGKEYVVIIDNDSDGDNGYVIATVGTCGPETTVNYSISNVPAGTYYVYALVRIVSSHDSPPESGDYFGFYGTGSIEPSEANAVVPSSGTVVFDITLSIMDVTGSLKIINNTSKSITEVYLWPMSSSTSEWGPNQLSTTISPGGTLTIQSIPPDDYKLKVVFSDNSTHEEYDISIVGSQTYPVELTEEDTAVRFYNDLTCGGSFFTATLDVCGASLNSESGSWSSCKTVSPGTCSWSLSTEPTNCSEISLSGSISLDSDCVYNFLLSYEDPNIVLMYTKSCPGDCSTATPFSTGASFESLSDDDSFELLMEIPFEGEGLTTAQ